ncbi:MAG: hypothetical protein CR967_02960 [Proteobacteria bacterium]|nr:MAG: hypothetical protein CR967_02960 [Pseudomonadota bacterium]
MKLLSTISLILALCISAYAYKPPLKQVEVNGVKLYVLADDIEEGLEDGMIDQFWLAEAIKENKVPKGIHFIDLRDAKKYKVSHIKGAINAPYNRDKESMDKSKLPKDGIIVFYCDTGIKSTEARTTFEDEKEASRIFVFDTAYRCDKEYKNCLIKPNGSQ